MLSTGARQHGRCKDLTKRISRSGVTSNRPRSEHLTCDGVLNDRVLQVLTHPLLAAFPWEADVLRVGAVRSGTTCYQRARWHTADPATSALAVVVAGGLKKLALLVRDAVQFAAQILPTCNGHKCVLQTPAPVMSHVKLVTVPESQSHKPYKCCCPT